MSLIFKIDKIENVSSQGVPLREGGRIVYPMMKGYVTHVIH